jgi:hypothetical protein
MNSREVLGFDPMSTQVEDILFALGSGAKRTGEQAGALLVVIQLLARNRLISLADVKKLVGLLSAESPEAQRRVTAQCVFLRKARPVRRRP